MSERIVWRPYWDYEREERWLNVMAAEGWELERYTWCRYVFERGAPGRYVYRIQLLPKAASAPESRDYLRFLEESGTEVVDTYMSWVYVRKAADGRPFELFTDLASTVAHHKRVAALFGSLAAAQLPLFTVSLMNVTEQVRERVWFGVPLLALALVLVAITGTTAFRQYSAMRRLEREGAVHE